MKIYLQSGFLNEESISKIKDSFPNIVFTHDKDDTSVKVAITFPNYVTKERIKKNNKLKWIQFLSAGFDTVDVDILQNTNIIFTNAKDIYSITIAEDVIGRMLMINRNVKKYLQNMKEKVWKKYNDEVELYGSTVGIVGVGSIGKEIAKRLEPFNVNVIGYRRRYEQEPYFNDIYIGKEGLENLLKQSDYIILALPLNKESYHLINAKTLKLMKPNAVLINIARGEIINQEDLIVALENNWIRAASLDVAVPEPLPSDNKLWTLDNVYITPHNSLSSPNISMRLAELICENIQNFISGNRLINMITL
ncbi:MAG TPA: D-2-hydroxyacid dehydrogenase [Acholeplasmataceae bacterium]|nr:D-2-hydroxyacid dehydrogenase [Acholeplasmataceae bacterium]